MVNQARCFLSAHNCLVECLQRQRLGAHRIRQRPSNNPPGVHIGHERGVREAFPGAHISNVRHPQPIGARGLELTIHQIRAKIRALGFARCDWCPTFCPCRTAQRCASAGLCARGHCQCPGGAVRATSSGPRRRRNSQHERHECAPRKQRREDCGRLSPGL